MKERHRAEISLETGRTAGLPARGELVGSWRCARRREDRHSSRS